MASYSHPVDARPDSLAYAQVRSSPDRTALARVGLVVVAISLFAGRSPVGLLPLVLSLMLPRFRVLGWWITVVLTTLLTAVTVGAAVFLLRTSGGAASGPVLYAAACMAGTLVGCGLSLVGLLSPGTRRAVEQRTLEVAPGAFTPPPPRGTDPAPAGIIRDAHAASSHTAPADAAPADAAGAPDDARR